MDKKNKRKSNSPEDLHQQHELVPPKSNNECTPFIKDYTHCFSEKELNVLAKFDELLNNNLSNSKEQDTPQQ